MCARKCWSWGSYPGHPEPIHGTCRLHIETVGTQGWKQHTITEMQVGEGEQAKWGRWGDTYAAFRYVVRVMHDVSGQAKVTYLHDFPLCQEDVASSQVPVDTLHRKREMVLVSIHPPLDSSKTGHFMVAGRAAWCTSERLSWHTKFTSRLPSQPLS